MELERLGSRAETPYVRVTGDKDKPVRLPHQCTQVTSFREMHDAAGREG